MTGRTYLDWNATALLRQRAREGMIRALDTGGNASSVHAEGRAARAAIERARAEVAALVGVAPAQVTFTSGATEANVLALSPSLGDCLFVSAVEHPSVMSGNRFPPESVERLPVTSDGVVDIAALRQALAGAERPLVSVMHANNETGAIQPIDEVAEIVHAAGGFLHVDAAQTAGRIPCRFDGLGADLMSISAHKLGGPPGIGALIRRSGIEIDPMIRGGGQERGYRAGTENLPAIVGFGAAASAALAAIDADAARMARLRDRFEIGLRAIAPGAVVFAERAPRLPNTSLFAVPGLKAETALIAFDLKGIALSAGSACSSGKVAGSPVLQAMGIAPALAAAALRLSVGWETRENDIETMLLALKSVVSALPKAQSNPVLAA